MSPARAALCWKRCAGLPGVTVDQEGHVLLRGSDKVAILMDGKQSSLTGYGRQTGLDSIPANNIDRIEIINNPSSRYDASGMAGVINIVYKEDKELGPTWRCRPDPRPRARSLGARPIFRPILEVMPAIRRPFRASTLTTIRRTGTPISRPKSFFRRALPNNEFTTRYYDDGREIRSQVPENRHQIQHVVKAGADWRADDNDTLSFSSIFDREHHRDRAEVPFIDAATMQRLRFWFWTEQETTGYLNFTSNFKHEFGDAGHELKFGAQYTRGWEDESYYLNEVSPIRTGTDETHLNAVEHTIPVTLDYVRPMKSGRLEAGAKLQIRRLPIDYDVVRGPQSVIYPGLGDTSKWGENIYAGYLNYVHEKRSYAVEAGIRRRADRCLL